MTISPPAELLAMLHEPNPCFIATIKPDGAPQLTQTWIDTDGTHVLINTVKGHRKLANIARTHASRSTSATTTDSTATGSSTVTSSPPPPRAPPTTSKHSRSDTPAAPTKTTEAVKVNGCSSASPSTESCNDPGERPLPSGL